MIYIVNNSSFRNKIDAMMKHVDAFPDEKYIFFSSSSLVFPYVGSTNNFVFVDGELIESFDDFDIKEDSRRIVMRESWYYQFDKDIPEDYNIILESTLPTALRIYYNEDRKEYETEKEREFYNRKDSYIENFSALIQLMKEENLISIQENKKIVWIGKQEEPLALFRNLVTKNNIYYHNGKLIYCYDFEVLKKFKSVWILESNSKIEKYLDYFRINYLNLFVKNGKFASLHELIYKYQDLITDL